MGSRSHRQCPASQPLLWAVLLSTSSCCSSPLRVPGHVLSSSCLGLGHGPDLGAELILHVGDLLDPDPDGVVLAGARVHHLILQVVLVGAQVHILVVLDALVGAQVHLLVVLDALLVLQPLQADLQVLQSRDGVELRPDAPV